MKRMMQWLALVCALPLATPLWAQATGDLGVVIERATGSVLIVDQSEHAALRRVEGLGDLSHASLVYSPDQQFAYIFGRDGALTKLDILSGEIITRVIQAGNSIGGAISDDGRLVAVSNYEPGGVRIFDADTLEMVAEIPTGSKTIGLVDAPGRRFVFSLWDAGETWIADMSGDAPQITKIPGMGDNPYDALITGDGRTYIAGLFGDDHLSALDLWQSDPQPQKVFAGYAAGAPICRSTRCHISRAGRSLEPTSFYPPWGSMRCCGSMPGPWPRPGAPQPTASRSLPWRAPTGGMSGSTSPIP